MDDDDIRQALHATYAVAGTAPTFTPDVFKERATRPRRSPLATSLVAVVAAVVVAVPVSVGLLLRAGVIGSSGASSLSVLDLHMYGPDDGWAWSGGDNILHTTSGVGQWTIVHPPIGSELIAGLAFVNVDSARLLAAPADSYDELERTYTLTPWTTDDGGATWTEGQPFRVLLEAGADPIADPKYPDLDFVDPLHGWFDDAQNGVGAPKFIYRTVDGGIHWTRVEMTPASGKAALGALPVDCTAQGMTFVSTTTGWVAGQCAANGTYFYVTHDGGATWRPQSIACIKCVLYPPVFSSRLDGQMYVGSGNGGLFVTDDGGMTWNLRPAPPSFWPDFIDGDHGFVMGLTGNDNARDILWTTTDGGMTWHEAPGGVINGNGPDQSSQLDFINPRTGWAVWVDFRPGGPLLANGQTPQPVPPPELWQTNDAGSTWTQVTPTFTESK
jgi:photosystem II stability/assembly factor-like uncharacterized protein